MELVTDAEEVEGVAADCGASGEEIFMSQNPAAPAIGDMKIYWDVTEPTTVSLIATQNGKTFQPIVSHNGKNIELLENGTKSSDLMLQNAKDQNSTLTWILRFFGFFMMFMGLGMVFKPLAVVADVVPLFGSIVGMGTSLVAFLISATVSLIVIALAWIVYRPIIGIGLLVAAAVGIFFLIKMKKAKAPVVNPV